MCQRRRLFCLDSTAFSTLLICFSSLSSMLPVGAWLEFPGSKCTLLTTCDAKRRGRLPNRLLQSAVHVMEFLVPRVCVFKQRCSVLHVKLSSFFLGLVTAPPDAVAILGCPCSYTERVLFFGKAWTLLDMKISSFLLHWPSPLPDAVGLVPPLELLRYLCPDPWSGVSDITTGCSPLCSRCFYWVFFLSPSSGLPSADGMSEPCPNVN